MQVKFNLVKSSSYICENIVACFAVILGMKQFRITVLIYSVNLRIQSKYKKIRTRNKSVFGHYLRGVFQEKLYIGCHRRRDIRQGIQHKGS